MLPIAGLIAQDWPLKKENISKAFSNWICDCVVQMDGWMDEWTVSLFGRVE